MLQHFWQKIWVNSLVLVSPVWGAAAFLSKSQSTGYFYVLLFWSASPSIIMNPSQTYHSFSWYSLVSECVELTFYGAVARHLLGHQRSLFVFAVDLHYLLPTLAALGSGQSRDGLLPADLTLRLLLPGLQTGRQPSGRIPLLVERWILIGPLDRCWDGRHLGVRFTDVGAVVIVAHQSGLDWRVLEDLICRFFQHALCLGLIQLAFAVCDWHPLALRSSSQVAVAVDGVKVFRDRVLIVVAVQPKFLFRPVGVVHVLRGRGKKLMTWHPVILKVLLKLFTQRG